MHWESGCAVETESATGRKTNGMEPMLYLVSWPGARFPCFSFVKLRLRETILQTDSSHVDTLLIIKFRCEISPPELQDKLNFSGLNWLGKVINCNY